MILRSKLSVLEAALGMGETSWFVLREVCFTLARQLRDHIRREEALVAACRQALPSDLLERISAEHHDEPSHLRMITRLFVQERGQRLQEIRPELMRVIAGLRHHMDEEEAELFPILGRVLGEQEEAMSSTAAPRARVDEQMTVNHVVQEFPQTRAAFERLFVSIPMEGCHCLDEVAWAHGMECRQLLEALDAAIEPRRVTLEEREAPADPDAAAVPAA